MRCFVVVVCGLMLVSGCAFAQAADSEPKAAVQPAIQSLTTSNPSVNPIEDQGRMAFAGKVSMLGVGAEVAARVTHRSNVRAGFNVMGYSRTFDKDGATYNGHLSMRTFETHYDFYPWARSFHISPGMLAFVGNPITAKAFLSQGQSFTLGGTDYTSDPANPVHVNGRLNFNQVAPMITVGFGNLVHRDSKRFTVPIEIGVAFQGSPKTNLKLTGNVCDSQGMNCQSVSNSSVQQDIVAEQNKLNNDIKAFKVYPIISVGFGYKF